MTTTSPEHKRYLKYVWFTSLIKASQVNFEPVMQRMAWSKQRNMSVDFQRKKKSGLFRAQEVSVLVAEKGQKALSQKASPSGQRPNSPSQSGLRCLSEVDEE